MPKNVLITGASGLVGTRLTELMQQKGYHVSHLSRRTSPGSTQAFQWDIKNGKLDERALIGVDTIIHLAGAGIADKPWTDNRKKEILESRTRSTSLLHRTLKNSKHHVKTFVSASAIGYYGDGGPDQIFHEDDRASNDFLANVVKDWENAVDQISTTGIRVVKLRIGILLSEKGGALAEIVKPIKWGVGAPLGSSKQLMSWIHIDDVCNMFIKAVEDQSMVGVYNAVGPTPTTNAELTKTIAKILGRPLWLPNIPAFVLKMILGEMASLVLGGSRVSAEKIQRAGFEFLFTDLEYALKSLLLKSPRN